jgi:predicted GTPase
VTGCGKSTLCNILALEDKWNSIFDDPLCQPFKINSGETIITYAIKTHCF